MRSIYKTDGKLREQERDTAKYWRKHNIRISLFGLENETEPESDMPIRVFGYDGASYRDQLFYVKVRMENTERTIILVIRWLLQSCTLVLRTGINQLLSMDAWKTI